MLFRSEFGEAGEASNEFERNEKRWIERKGREGLRRTEKTRKKGRYEEATHASTQ